MWTPGPFETKASRAYYYLTDALPSWPADRQHEHLRDFNAPTLWNISIHEVYPGHYVHFQYLRNVTSKVRKSTFFAPMSFVEGWAHYCEQMMVEAGFRKSDQRSSSASSPSAGATGARRRRHPSALRGHVGGAGDALLPRRSVPRRVDGRREAERGTFDPSYVVYSIGKLMMLKLPTDYRNSRATSIRCAVPRRGAHQGSAPFWAHRRLLLGNGAGDAALE
jgi:hypothetical protein